MSEATDTKAGATDCLLSATIKWHQSADPLGCRQQATQVAC